jgi:hypothetical protein
MEGARISLGHLTHTRDSYSRVGLNLPAHPGPRDHDVMSMKFARLYELLGLEPGRKEISYFGFVKCCERRLRRLGWGVKRSSMVEVDLFISDPEARISFAVVCRQLGDKITETVASDILKIKRYRQEEIMVIVHRPCTRHVEAILSRNGIRVGNYDSLPEPQSLSNTSTVG